MAREGGGGERVSGLKKHLKTSDLAVLIKILFEVIYQNVTKNWIHVNYIPGGWAVYNQMYFLFTSWWVYNRWGYKRKFTVYKNNWNYYLAVDHRSSKH